MAANDYTMWITPLSVLYAVGFVFSCCALTSWDNTTLREKPWIPARLRGDACLTPFFFILPAFFWPFIIVVIPLVVVTEVLRGMLYLVRSLIGSATTCCGIPLPLWWPEIIGDVESAACSEADFEMGSAASRTEDDGEGGPDGGKDDSDPVGWRSAGSGESEPPPSYTSLPRDDDEDDSGEAVGLLDRSTDGELETGGK